MSPRCLASAAVALVVFYGGAYGLMRGVMALADLVGGRS